jgi:predicted Mrr-cat superfamily restriction endonuclease
MPNFWMVRAGEGTTLAAVPEQGAFVGLGFDRAGDLTGVNTLDEMRQRIALSGPEMTPLARARGAITPRGPMKKECASGSSARFLSDRS